MPERQRKRTRSSGGRRYTPIRTTGSAVGRSGKESGGESALAKGKPLTPVNWGEWFSGNAVMLAVVIVTLLYSYWPTLLWMADNWVNEPDYSHGWIVLPLACRIAFVRRDEFPGADASRFCRAGLVLVLCALVLRIVGRVIYADFVDAWSLVLMIAGGVWMLFGKTALVWALPAVLFLFFAIPIPYQAESLLSFQLQGVATKLSTMGLQILGQPAVSEGHLIWVGSERLDVEPACSGLRIFVGLMATAYYFAATAARNWWDRLVLVVSVIPTALFVNSLRIVVTGWLYQFARSVESRHAIHDYAGLLMIPAGFAAMYAVYCYWGALFRPVSQAVAKDFLPPVSEA